MPASRINYKVVTEVTLKRQEHHASLRLSPSQFLAFSHIGIFAPRQILFVFLNVCWVCLSVWIFVTMPIRHDVLWLFQLNTLWYSMALSDMPWYAPLIIRRIRRWSLSIIFNFTVIVPNVDLWYSYVQSLGCNSALAGGRSSERKSQQGCQGLYMGNQKYGLHWGFNYQKLGESQLSQLLTTDAANNHGHWSIKREVFTTIHVDFKRFSALKEFRDNVFNIFPSDDLSPFYVFSFVLSSFKMFIPASLW